MSIGAILWEGGVDGVGSPESDREMWGGFIINDWSRGAIY